MIKRALVIAFIVLVGFGAGWYVQERLNNTSTTESSSVVLLEKIKEVCQLVTVEGNFSEIYTHQDYTYYNIFPFRKKALLRINAKVTAGYDLQKIDLKIDELTKTIYLYNLPEPEVMNIDTKISYYDLTEGTFNSFSGKDLTDLNHNAREFIAQKADKSALLAQAKKEGERTLRLITVFLEQAGYRVIITDQAPMLELK